MSPIAFMAKNPVAANILMLALLVGGGLMMSNIRQEVFPDIALDVVSATVVYPGAGPSEVESALCLPMEEAVSTVTGLDNLNCTAQEGFASLTLELEKGTDLGQTLQDVRSNLAVIQEWPKDAEVPQVSQVMRKRRILSLALSGPLEPKSLFDVARRIETKLLAVEGVSEVSFKGVRSTELVIEVEPQDLSQHGLSLRKLASIIAAESKDLPAGALKTEQGELLLRSLAKRTDPLQYAELVAESRPDGGVTKLGQIAKIEERPKESEDFSELDGEPTVFLEIYQKEDFTPNQVSESVARFVAQAKLPPSLKLVVWDDRSDVFNDRFKLMVQNGIQGLVLVFVILALFLEIHLAFWVMLGIPISFVASFLILSLTGVTINMISLVGYILVLGIVVDDAIVIGESVYSRIEKGESRLSAAIAGAMEMGPPVFFSMLTTVVAFAPLVYIGGNMGRFMYAIPVIVISVLTVSLVESLFVLPSHLAHPAKPFRFVLFRWIESLRGKCDGGLTRLIEGRYKRSLAWALENRYLVLSIGIASLILTGALVMGGQLPTQFFPSIEDDEVTLNAELPAGYPAEKSRLVLRQILATGIKVVEEGDHKKGLKSSSLLHHYVNFESQSAESGSLATIKLRLKPADQRSMSSFEIGQRWRKAVARLPEVSTVRLTSRGMNFGDDLNLQLAHSDTKTLLAAVEHAKNWAGRIDGVVDLSDSEKLGKRELRFTLTPEAQALGLTAQEFAADLRAAFSGVLVSRLEKEKQQIEVWVRYPKEVRSNLSNLENLRMLSPKGGEYALGQAAVLSAAQEPVSITRQNQERIITVSGKIEQRIKNPETITQAVQAELVPELKALYPGLSTFAGGAQKDRAQSLDSLGWGFLAALVFIYCLLAIFFKSYTQPMMVMSAIPFGIAGAALGHLILGHPLSFMSLFGLVGLTGVVVNDSLVLIDSVNRHPKVQTEPIAGLIEAAQDRVRPILMTSVTTFGGLMPLLAETSRQAQFLIPMAISLGVGILFATFITLFLVPCLFLIRKDILGR